jgi:hypothetical protein
METWLGVILLLVVGVWWIHALGRHTELARVRVVNGRVEFVRGRLPQSLLADLHDVLTLPPIEQGELRIVLDRGKPRVVASGLSEGRVQQLRNVVGGYEVSQIRAGRPPPR